MSAPFVRARTGECSLPYGHSIPYLPENVTLFLGKRRKSVDSTKEDGFSLLTFGRKWNTIKSGGRYIPSCYRSFHSPAGVLFRRLGKHAFFAKRKPLAELVERKSLRLWTKIKLLVKVKLGLPTNKTRNKEDLIVDKDISSLEHTRWRCQYHVVFAPKYRRLAIYGELKQDIGYILRKLCERKGIEIIEAEACPDHIHMLISIPPKLSVSQVMGYLKGKSSLMIFDRHANLKYKYGNRHFWARGYYVDTVGRNKKAIQEYIQNQLKEDELADQLSIKEYFDPFTGEKVDQGRKGQKGSFTSSKRK